MGKPRTLATLSLGVGAAGAGVAIIAAFRSDMRAAQARLAAQSRLVDTAFGPVEVAESGSGPPALVVHGSAGGFDQGMMAGKGSLGNDYHLIAPSRFGYLRSPMPADASHVAQADTLAALLDALNVPRTVVMAVSAGAQPATHLALRRPDRVQALVLITPALHLPPKPGTPPESGPPGFVLDYVLASDFIVWAVAHLVPNLLVRVAGVPPSLVGQVTPELRRELVDGFFPASTRHVGLAHDIRTTTPVAPDLPIEQLRMPVLLVGTADDPYKTGDVVRYSAGRLPTAKALILETGGHVLIGQQDRIRQEVQEFLGAHATHAK
jgi:2-hydroxy-6-oxonona-2,4-dienedioate hydrolase